MAASATFVYDPGAATITVHVVGSTAGHTIRAQSFDNDSAGDNQVSTGAPLDLVITGVGGDPPGATLRAVWCWDDFDEAVIGGTIFDQGVAAEYAAPMTWAYDGIDTVTVTIPAATNGLDYGLCIYAGGFTSQDCSDALGTGADLVLTAVFAETVPFFAECFTWTGPYNDWGCRVFTPGVAGAGEPGNPTSIPAVIDATTNITETSATLNGTVDPEGVASTAHFEYGLTTDYSFSTPNQSIGAGTGGVPVTADIAGLVPGRTYHARVVREP